MGVRFWLLSLYFALKVNFFFTFSHSLQTFLKKIERNEQTTNCFCLCFNFSFFNFISLFFHYFACVCKFVSLSLSMFFFFYKQQCRKIDVDILLMLVQFLFVFHCLHFASRFKIHINNKFLQFFFLFFSCSFHLQFFRKTN